MANDFYLSAAAKQLEALEVVKGEQLTQLRAHRLNNDIDSAAECVQQLADIERQQQNLRGLCDQYAASQQPQQSYASPESRASRTPAEMDAADLASLMNESRYSRLGTGKPFSAQDYNNLRRGLQGYKISRGEETK